MSWNAKPSGGYTSMSLPWTQNVTEINNYLNSASYALTAQAGLIGNAAWESGLNPWRWQGDSYNQSLGYGLFQFTPGRDYITQCSGVSGYGPNLSVTQITDGASPEDGLAQLRVMNSNQLGKWVSSCWRSYWDKTKYEVLYSLRTKILNQYGNGTTLSLSQFKTISLVEDATFAFMACFEGPAVPNLDDRYNLAVKAYSILSGDPVPPDPPDPPGPPDKPFIPKSNFKIWFGLRPF